jgi:MoaA/NifB/PqqE/SkfB family radical SAM enzyme
MKNTGFSEITKERALYKGIDPWYIEIALTGKCNFNCMYCNRFNTETNIYNVEKYFSTFVKCKHIQLTGGEPTLHKDFLNFVSLCKSKSNVIGLSTNGTYGLEKYEKLNINMFSISLDDYDCDILKQRGYKNPEKIIKTIQELSKNFYVNVGLVIDSININRIEDIIDFILNLGVNDIKLSTNTKDELIPKFKKDYSDYPILNYRVNNFKNNRQMRGFPAKQCYIVKNDITIVGDKHYPCLIYFREGGHPIGNINEHVYEDRLKWFESNNTKKDLICKKYCMDFKCEFNNFKQYHG